MGAISHSPLNVISDNYHDNQYLRYYAAVVVKYT